MGVRTYETGPSVSHRIPGPGTMATLSVGLVAVVFLLANGRPGGEIPAALLARGLLQGVRWVIGLVLEMDATGAALVGKLLAAVCGGVAAAALFAAVARRHPLADARATGLLLAVATTLAAASQSWSGEAPATAAVALAALLLTRSEAEDDPGLAARAAVPLALAVAFCPSTWALALALLSGVLVRHWRAGLRLLVWLTPAALVALVGLFLAIVGSPDEAPTGGLAVLLLSPGRGVLVFAPVILVGLAGLARAVRPSRGRHHWDAPSPAIWLPLTFALAAAAHFGAVALDGGWTTGPFWGPRLLAPAAPLLLLFLPEGLGLLRGAGVAIAAVSVMVQALGALAYDGRWDRLYGDDPSAAWDPRRSPIVFQVRERVVRPAFPALAGRRLVVREHPLVIAGPTGSRITFSSGATQVDGADPTFGDVFLEGGARVVDGQLRLSVPGDALFFRVRTASRPRRLQLRVVARGPGILGVGEQTFWTAPRWTEHRVESASRVRTPYSYAESGGGDIRLVSRGSGPLEITSVALVPPAEPENVIRLP